MHHDDESTDALSNDPRPDGLDEADIERMAREGAEDLASDEAYEAACGDWDGPPFEVPADEAPYAVVAGRDEDARLVAWASSPAEARRLAHAWSEDTDEPVRVVAGGWYDREGRDVYVVEGGDVTLGWEVEPG